ncbi:hypothetical protein Ae201684P_016381 [Aphanomyces euteiches]|nr:hypothetical protein Ae201684P_016381 [Aphanomyces euteiches]
MTRANITQRKITYRCSFYRSQKCKARLEYYSSTMDYDYDSMTPHTCFPRRPAETAEIESISSISVITAMKRAVDSYATSTAKSPEQIWETVRTQFYNQDKVIVHGLSKIQVVKRVHRARASHFGLSVHGRVEVPPLTNVHSKPEDKIDRLVGWAHPQLITLLRYDNITLFLDGTFRCTPNGFTQCIVLMVFDCGTKLYVPVFYVLSTSKSYDAYWNALQYVNDTSGESLKPKEIVCDFEKSLVNAVCDRFSGVEVMGCFFHFKQACQRHMIKYRIPPGEVKIAMSSGVLDMLNVIEPDKVEKQGIKWVRRKIKESCDEGGLGYSKQKWSRFWKYFVKTWIHLYPPHLWTVHGVRMDAVARTNNPLERFNRELNSSFGTPHPSLPRFVQVIEEISRKYVKLREDIQRGLAAPPSRRLRMNLPRAVTLNENGSGESSEDIDDEE